MLTRQEIKENAKNQIKGNIGTYYLCLIVMSLIVSVASVISPLLTPSFSLSFVMFALAMSRGEKIQFSDLFKGFNIFGKALWLYIITSFFVGLWSLLLIVPGIIKSLSYSFAPYILAENPNMTAREALNESKRITKGRLGDIFILDLSFIGWLLLVPLTFGLIMIWLAPYMETATAGLYNEIRAAASEQPESYDENNNIYSGSYDDSQLTTPVFDNSYDSMQYNVNSDSRDNAVSFETMKPQALDQNPQPNQRLNSVPVQKTQPKKIPVREIGITCASGMYEGATFNINSSEEIVIGKDPRCCSIILDSSEKLISNKHVSVRYDRAKAVYIVTNYSPIGTYINGQAVRLGIPTPVTPGSLLKLGDDRNLFLLN